MDIAFGNHIVMLPKEYSQCIGCGSCELMCGLLRDGVTGSQQGRIKFQIGDLRQMYHSVLVCQQCEDHPCYDACPKQDEAMCIDENGIVYVNEEECVGCGLCAKACHFTPSRIVMNKKEKKAKKCDMCRTREGGPACISECPVCCLGESAKPLPNETEE